MRIAVVVWVLLAARTARAQRPEDAAIALALFNEGRDLAAHGDYIHACPKFASARSLEPWLGIELNLADCDEHLGLTASAWVLFRQAGDQAERQGDLRAAYARERAQQLEPALTHVALQAAPGVQIRLDAEPLPPGGLGVPLPIDPGEHVVEASAPGRATWSRRVVVTSAQTLNVVVPALELAVTQPVPTLRPRRSRWVLALGGTGIVAVGTSLVLGLDAKLRYDEVRGCDANLVCDARGFAAVHDARLRGDIATIVGGAGVVALAAALIIHWRLPVTPLAAPSTLGVSVQGSL